MDTKLPIKSNSYFNVSTNSNNTVTLLNYNGKDQEIEVDEPITHIKMAAFYKINNVKKITFGKKVVDIEEGAIFNCQDLETIVISENLQKLSPFFFKSCQNLVNIIIAKENPFFVSKDGCVYSKDMTKLLRVPEGKSGKIRIEDSVKTISHNAFFFCKKITEVVIPSKVSKIGRSAFFKCESLEKVTFENSEESKLKEFPLELFYGCSNLKQINIPQSVVSLKDSVFSGCEKIQNIDIGENIHEIGLSVFDRCRSLEKINLPKTMQEIPANLCCQCESLKEITLPEDISLIGDFAFYKCESLKSISIPSSVKRIAKLAFSGCKSIKSVFIPQHVYRIGWNAFCDCTNLEDITVEKDNKSYKSLDGCLYDGNGSTLIFIPQNKSGTITIPSSVEDVFAYVFENRKNIERIVFENKKLNIKEYWFGQKDNNNIYLSSYGSTSNGEPEEELYTKETYSMLKLYAKNFYPSQIKRSSKIHILDAIASYINTSLSSTSNSKDVLEKTVIGTITVNEFGGKSIVYSDEQKNIMDEKWKLSWLKYIQTKRRSLYENIINIPSLLDLCIKNKLLKIEDVNTLIEISSQNDMIDSSSKLLEYQKNNFSFEETQRFMEKELVPDVTSVSYLKKFWNYKKNNDGTLTITSYKGEEENIIIPAFIGKNKVTGIGEHALSPLKSHITKQMKNVRENIKSIFFPSGITTMAADCIWGCQNLEKLDLPNTLKIQDNAKSYDNNQNHFYISFIIGCTSLKYLEIPEGISNIMPYTFSFAPALEEVIIPGSVNVIDENAFFDCRNLTKVIIKDGVKQIKSNAFGQNRELTEVSIPSSVEELDKKAFELCINLKKLEIRKD